MIIRNARIEDLSVLLEYEQGVITAERPFDPTLKQGSISYYDIEKMIGDENVGIVVAEVDLKIVACGYARIEKAKDYLTHNKHAYLGFMFVHPAYRGQGLNAKIIESLKLWALSKGLTEMRLDVYNDNVAAIKAYEKMGFAKHMVEMRVGIS